jgi:hypothetical protein
MQGLRVIINFPVLKYFGVSIFDGVENAILRQFSFKPDEIGFHISIVIEIIR